jgi:hypothetical protein
MAIGQQLFFIFFLLLNPIFSCPPGSYLLSETCCVECPLGFYSNETNSTDCYACEPGFHTFDGNQNTRCFTCQPGTYSDVPGSYYCRNCSDGFYQPEYGKTECERCPVNTYTNNNTNNSNKSICLPCPSGTDTRLMMGISECLPCLLPNCSQCPKGFYIENYTCIQCPNGTTNNPENGTLECVECLPGFYNNQTNYTKCYPCESGFYISNHDGNTSCFACKPGTYSDIPGSYYCRNCPDGFYQPEYGKSECKACPVNTYTNNNTNNSNKSICSPCPSRTDTRLMTGISRCLPCLLPNCSQCPKGFYIENYICIPCSNGTTNNPENGTFECELNCSTPVECFLPSIEYLSDTIIFPMDVPPPAVVYYSTTSEAWFWIMLTIIIVFVFVAIISCCVYYRRPKTYIIENDGRTNMNVTGKYGIPRVREGFGNLGFLRTRRS